MANRSSSTVKLSVVPLLAASFLAGCGDEEEQAYCVDADDQVVENRYCDDEYYGTSGAGAYFWYFTSPSSRYGVGQQVAGGTRIAASNRAALASRGGFGGTASSEGVGRSFTRSGGG